jgi:hypothetical protein
VLPWHGYPLQANYCMAELPKIDDYASADVQLWWYLAGATLSILVSVFGELIELVEWSSCMPCGETDNQRLHTKEPEMKEKTNKLGF